MDNKNNLLLRLSNKTGRIVQAKELKELLSLTYKSLRAKLNGDVPFKLIEIKVIAHHYNLTNDEIVELFINE